MSFHFLNDVWKSKFFFNFDAVQVIKFFFIDYAFGVTDLRNFSLTQSHKSFSWIL